MQIFLPGHEFLYVPYVEVLYVAKRLWSRYVCVCMSVSLQFYVCSLLTEFLCVYCVPTPPSWQVE